MTNTRKFLAIVMVVAMCFSMFSTTAFATDSTIANGTAGEGVTWVLDSEGTLTISGEGEIVVDWYAPPWEEYNDLIKTIVVEEGITEVPDSAFAYAENLVTVSVPSTVTHIGTIAFWSNYSLESINVAEENTTYKDIDGVLFTEDEKTLVAYPANKSGAEYTIPANVTTIEESAFSFNISLESLTIPDTVTALGEYTFESSELDTIIVGNGITEIPRGCFARSSVKTVVISDLVKAINYAAFWTATELETLIIGSGVETIADDILRYTNSLSVVHYKGTQNTWDAISIDEDNEDLNNKEIHFISGEIKEGTESTCADGHTAGYYCDDCEAYLTGDVIEAVDEHVYDDGVVFDPSCTIGGYTLYTCTVCGDSYTDDETEMTGHTIGDDGLCETCGEECVHIEDKIDGKCDYCGLEFDYKEIYLDETNTIHIPEEHEPVIVKFTPTESGLFVLISDNGGDDDNIDPYVDVYDSKGELVGYDDDNDYVDTYNFYCDFEAEAGKTYYIALYAYDSDVEYDYTVEKCIDIDHQPTSGEPYVTLTWSIEADEYQWYLLDDGQVAIEDETEARLQNPEIGSTYGCLVTYDGEEYYSDVLYYGYAITHQPTADEPYVELNDDTDATYQWYKVEEGFVELTDENTIPFPSEEDGPVYDATNGWSNGVYIDRVEGLYDGYAYFVVPLEEGDKLELQLSGDYLDTVEIVNMMVGSFKLIEADENGKCEFVATEEDYYAVVVYKDIDGEEPSVKAYSNGYEYTEIDGATDSEFAPTEEGMYACKVTFADDSTEMSDVLEYEIVDDDDDDVNNNSGNTGSTTDPNKGNTTDDKKPVKPEKIPNTDATESNVWFALLVMSAMGVTLIMASNKKKVFTK